MPQSPNQPRTFAPDPASSRSRLVTLLVLPLLLGGVAVVLVVLPGRVASNTEQQHAVDEQVVSVQDAPPTDKGLTDADAEAARELRQQVFQRQAQLENEGVKVWGARQLATSYPEAMKSFESAEEHLAAAQYKLASLGYREALTNLKQLEGSRPDRVRQAIESGDAALMQMDHQGAKAHYTIALAGEPDNEAAKSGTRRAENLPGVLEHVDRGKQHEQRGELNQAAAAYQQAVAMDDRFAPARDDLSRVNGLIVDRDFRAHLTNAVSALDESDHEGAMRALDAADRLRPKDSSVADLRGQVAQAARRTTIATLREQAHRHEQAEQWVEAIGVYEQVLTIDPDTSFALQGKARSQGLAEVSNRVQGYLTEPQKLQTKTHRDYARKMCEMIASTDRVGQKLSGDAKRLATLIDQYTQLVPVLVCSDGYTNVKIMRVGHLGQIVEHNLNLPPGEYKAYGTRSGYRDVAVPLIVRPGAERQVLTVVCKDKL